MRTGPDDFRGQPDSHLNHAPLPCLSPAGFDPKLSGPEAQWVLDPRQTGEGVIWPGQVERLSLPGEPLLPCRHDAPWSRTKPRAEALACRCRHQTPVFSLRPLFALAHAAQPLSASIDRGKAWFQAKARRPSSLSFAWAPGRQPWFPV